MDTKNDEEKNTNIDETLDKVADLLNEASISLKDADRITNLKHVQELIVYKHPALLDNFLDEILQFQLDKSAEVKKFIISFIEEACKRDFEVIFKVIDNFRYLLFDENVNVQKRAYLAMISIFKNTLKWVAKRKLSLNEEQQQTWSSLIDIKLHIVAQLDSDNDGVRTTAIKFIEMLIIVLSPRIKESLVPNVNDSDFSLDQLSNEHPILDKLTLLEEGRSYMRKLLDYTLSTHISSVNLISSICVLSNIAKQRPEYMNIVLDTYSDILKNMPPTLGKSQVSTVKKQMKLQIILICKNSCCVDFQSQIVSLLSELGASTSEINKTLPKNVNQESRKRNITAVDLNSPISKKSKLQSGLKIKEELKISQMIDSAGLEKVTEDLVVKLSVKENIADLVILSMTYLPEQMPTAFQNTYKPISAAGTIQQIKSLARLLAIQLNEAGLLNLNQQLNANIQPIATSKLITIDDLDNEDDDMEDIEYLVDNKQKLTPIKVEKSDSNEAVEQMDTKPSKSHQTPSTPLVKPANIQSLLKKKNFSKTFKLNEVTGNSASQFNTKSLEELLSKTYSRILGSEPTVSKCKEAANVRKRVLVETTSLPNYEDYLNNYIFEDIKKRIDLGLMWIYNSYIKLKQAYKQRTKIENFKLEKMDYDDEIVEVQSEEIKLKRKNDLDETEKENFMNIQKYELDYDRVLYNILYGLQKREDPKDLLFSRIICQVPLITENALKLLKTFCQDEKRYLFSMNTLCDLIKTHITQRQIFINLLLEFTHHSNTSFRENAIGITLTLNEKEEFSPIIEKYALERLKYLILPAPPINIYGEMNDENLENSQWTEETIKTCLYLYLDLMPTNHSLIHSLSKVYIASISEVKKVILKMLEKPIRNMGMNSPQLLKLIEEFPSGSETLVLRIIHILTEKSAPSSELVEKVRNLNDKRLFDVRFLIPILTGLSKTEIIAALPQLIKLSQPVVKEVFNRLLGINVNTITHKSPIAPSELLAALHQIDQANCDLKTVISATSLCFNEKQIYTQEVLASVMQQLIDITPIPTLYMRTVIQSVTMYPKLSGFVIIMMQRLIGKQIWKYPKVWEGFIKCCQRIKPLSHQVLLQLPQPQLNEVFRLAPDLKDHVSKHVSTLNPQQKSQIPEQLLQFIEQNQLNNINPQ